ncbi:hypothetical protein [Alkalimarinus sediminis]|uniref:Kazal-like domain-containing protein n=1 Tax=Alkalimarinus sediminis TaxID=1632866 RepID=A0A9E8HNJ2_9ALTE|nr:hypothetical protein [Alkalimarinus sediminis]UZW73571.1 hypothetical protein NNL22_11020 [Alkalimarinus sediminis]
MNNLKSLLGVMFVSVLLSGCATTAEKVAVATACEDPRPQVCTMIYMPVCGLDEKGDFNTYASGCNACSRTEVVGYNDGACEDSVTKKEH